jgi:hypothetical protein
VTNCRVCATEAIVSHHGKVLVHHDVTYYRCPACEFWFTEEPYWLDQAYFEIIKEVDQGLVQRNISIARQLGALLPRLFPKGPYVDWASGCGLLVRLMRDAGFEFYWDDKYAQNVLAREYSWDDDLRAHLPPVTFVSAIEVLEHTPEPLEFIRGVFERTGTSAVFFTECLHDGTSYDPDWWYLLPDSGQHVSFYSAKTLQTMADILGLSLQSWGTYHLLTTQPLPPKALRRALKTSQVITYLTKYPARLSASRSSLGWHVSKVRRARGGSTSQEGPTAEPAPLPGPH